MKRLSVNLLKAWVNKPFPFYSSLKEKILVPIFFSGLVMIGILLIGRPKNSLFFWQHFLGTLKYGTVVIALSIFCSTGLPWLFPNLFNPRKWTVLKTIIFFSSSVFVITVFMSILSYYVENIRHITLSNFLLQTLMRSVTFNFLPVILLFVLAELQLYKINYDRPSYIAPENSRRKKEMSNFNPITFGKNRNDEIELTEVELYYIKADGNYCELYFVKEEIPQKHLIRSSLKSIEKKLGFSNSFLRCHKSYIVNFSAIQKVSGNKKGYVILMKELNTEIPVSRNIPQRLIERIKAHG